MPAKKLIIVCFPITYFVIFHDLTKECNLNASRAIYKSSFIEIKGCNLKIDFMKSAFHYFTANISDQTDYILYCFYFIVALYFFF